MAETPRLSIKVSGKFIALVTEKKVSGKCGAWAPEGELSLQPQSYLFAHKNKPGRRVLAVL